MKLNDLKKDSSKKKVIESLSSKINIFNALKKKVYNNLKLLNTIFKYDTDKKFTNETFIKIFSVSDEYNKNKKSLEAINFEEDLFNIVKILNGNKIRSIKRRPAGKISSKRKKRITKFK